MHRTADLLQPIYEAQLYSVVSGNVVTMDETPIKAGRKRRGKMKTGYFWPIYGDRDEVVFPFSDSRSGAFIREQLGEFCGVLLTDGYPAYEKYAAQINGVVHAQCWSHTRRHFLKAEDIEPELTAKALEYRSAGSTRKKARSARASSTQTNASSCERSTASRSSMSSSNG